MDDSKILVFDLECTCWKGRPPAGMRQEIIEIGCCLFDKTADRILDRRSIIVRPSCSIISGFCTELTTITQDMVDREGVDLHEACDMLVKEYNSKNVMSAAWGRFDSKHLKLACKSDGIPFPLSGKHMNLQRRFLGISKTKQEMSVGNALRFIGKEFDGVKHRAVNDAYNTAVLLSHIMSTATVSANGHH